MAAVFSVSSTVRAKVRTSLFNFNLTPVFPSFPSFHTEPGRRFIGGRQKNATTNQ